MRVLAFILATFLLSVSVAVADSGHDMPKMLPDVSSPELNRIKELQGRWRSTTSMFGKKDEEVFTEYSVTAGGSAVLEKIFPGSPNEMVSVYYDDENGKLAMTHYCMLRNRPSFHLEKADGKSIQLAVTKVEGLKSPNAPSMGAITLRFEDQDHFSSTCGGSAESKEKHEAMTMRFSRVK